MSSKTYPFENGNKFIFNEFISLAAKPNPGFIIGLEGPCRRTELAAYFWLVENFRTNPKNRFFILFLWPGGRKCGRKGAGAEGAKGGCNLKSPHCTLWCTLLRPPSPSLCSVIVYVFLRVVHVRAIYRVT